MHTTISSNSTAAFLPLCLNEVFYGQSATEIVFMKYSRSEKQKEMLVEHAILSVITVAAKSLCLEAENIIQMLL